LGSRNIEATCDERQLYRGQHCGRFGLCGHRLGHLRRSDDAAIGNNAWL
jgi:hypothetical protein